MYFVVFQFINTIILFGQVHFSSWRHPVKILLATLRDSFIWLGRKMSTVFRPKTEQTVSKREKSCHYDVALHTYLLNDIDWQSIKRWRLQVHETNMEWVSFSRDVKSNIFLSSRSILGLQKLKSWKIEIKILNN